MLYMTVTCELVHEIPSQPLPQGSDPIQLSGVFFQIDLRAFREATAPKLNNIHVLLVNNQILK